MFFLIGRNCPCGLLLWSNDCIAVQSGNPEGIFVIFPFSNLKWPKQPPTWIPNFQSDRNGNIVVVLSAQIAKHGGFEGTFSKDVNAPGRYNNRELNPMIGASVHVEIPRAFSSTNFRKIFEITFHLRTPMLIFDSYVVLI